MLGSLLLLLIALAALGVCAWLAKANKKSAPKKDSTQAVQTAQDLVAFADFRGNWAARRDGTLVAFIAVEGRNHAFMTPAERELDTTRVEAALASFDRPYMLHRVQRPVDATGPLNRLKAEEREIKRQEDEAQEKAASAKAKGNSKDARALQLRASSLRAKRELIETVYLPQALALQGAFEVQTYVTISRQDAPDAARLLSVDANTFVRVLSMAGYPARIMVPSEIMAALANYYGRFPSAAERDAMGFGEYDKKGCGIDAI